MKQPSNKLVDNHRLKRAISQSKLDGNHANLGLRCSAIASFETQNASAKAMGYSDFIVSEFCGIM